MAPRPTTGRRAHPKGAGGAAATPARSGNGSHSGVEPVARRGNATGEATRLRLVLTAERLFAERGIAAVSLREVGQVAGQRNNAATQYHFGDRDGLVDAVMANRTTVTEGRRTEVLDVLEAEGRVGDVRAVVSALVLPLAEQEEPGNHYLGFLAHFLVERGRLAGRDLPGPHRPYLRLAEVLHACVPDLPDDVFGARYELVTEWTVGALAAHQMAASRGEPVVPIDALVEELLEMLTAAMTAPHGAR